MTGELYGKDITETLLDLYFTTLSEFNIDTISQSFTAHIKSTEKAGTFFPKPADIIRQINGTCEQKQKELDDCAETAWSEIVQKMSSIGSYGNFESEDKRSVSAVISMGGWKRLCASSDYSNLPWLKKEFMSVYSSLQNRSLEELPNYAPGYHEIENSKKIGSEGGGFSSLMECLDKYKDKKMIE